MDWSARFREPQCPYPRILLKETVEITSETTCDIFRSRTVSLMELETHLLIARKLNYLSADDVEPALAQSGELSRKGTENLIPRT